MLTLYTIPLSIVVPGSHCCIMPSALVGHHDSRGRASSRNSDTNKNIGRLCSCSDGSVIDRIRSLTFDGQTRRIQKEQHQQQPQLQRQQQRQRYNRSCLLRCGTFLTSLWSARMGLGRWPGFALVVCLLLGTLSSSTGASMTLNNAGTSSSNSNSHDENSSGRVGQSKSLAAPSTLCPPRCKCYPNKQASINNNTNNMFACKKETEKQKRRELKRLDDDTSANRGPSFI